MGLALALVSYACIAFVRVARTMPTPLPRLWIFCRVFVEFIQALLFAAGKFSNALRRRGPHSSWFVEKGDRLLVPVPLINRMFQPFFGLSQKPIQRLDACSFSAAKENKPMKKHQTPCPSKLEREPEQKGPAPNHCPCSVQWMLFILAFWVCSLFSDVLVIAQCSRDVLIALVKMCLQDLCVSAFKSDIGACWINIHCHFFPKTWPSGSLIGPPCGVAYRQPISTVCWGPFNKRLEFFLYQSWLKVIVKIKTISMQRSWIVFIEW